MTEIVTPAGTVGYGYNAAGEQVTLIQPEGTVTTGYDVNGFVDTVTDWRGDTITMTNDADGRMIDVARSNGVDSVYGYDTAGRLNNIAHTNGATLIDSFSYTLDGNGNRVGVTSNAGVESYTLDGLNRITNATYPGALEESFVYDASGNRTSHTDIDGATTGYTVDTTGQLISDTTGATFTYDDAGNLTGTSAGDAYVYDDYGRATEITAAGVTETYGYDAQDVRIAVDGTTQLWDRSGLPTLISTSAGDNYVHANGVARDGNDWLLADAVGSVRATVDQTGVVSAETAFTAYGEPLQGSTETFGFAGEQHDPTGLQHLRARQYNPGLGRFTTVDPVQPGGPGTGGYNLYTYSANNPTTFTDPTGQIAVETSSLHSRAAQNASTIRAFQSGVQAARFELIVANFAATATTSGSTIAAAGGGAAAAGGGSGAGAALIGAGVLAAGSLIVGGDTPEPKPETPIVLLPAVTEPGPDGEDQAEEPEPQLATDGVGARDGGGGVCEVISVDEALQRISDFLGGDGRLVVSGSGAFQWLTTEQVGADTVTRIARLDVNPSSPHVVRFGPHVNLETKINGVTVRSGSLADPHTAISPSSVRDGDFPTC